MCVIEVNDITVYEDVVFNKYVIKNSETTTRQIRLSEQQFEKYMKKVFEIAWENDNEVEGK